MYAPPTINAREPYLFLVILGVTLGIFVPFLRQVIQREDGGNRANRDAGAAINALHRVDVEHGNIGEVGFILSRMDTIHRANVYARGVLGVDTGFSNYISHRRFLPRASKFESPFAPT
jgi:tRNA A-37 threonylcarbamoyl transferase component Bud32